METSTKKRNQKKEDINFQIENKLEIIKKNREKYVQEMILMDRKKLNKNYNLVLIQKQKAYETKNHNAFEILYEMESQILETLVLQLG